MGSESESESLAQTPNYRTEIIAGLSTYLTLSYIFIVNPVLLAKIPGVDISQAFFATAVSAALSTLLMGLIAKMPFAVAPAPSITTFFVSYVCLTLGLPLPAAMAAVILSGVLSILMTWLAVRQNLIDSMPTALRIGIVFAISGFLVATGLRQAGLISHTNGFLDASSFASSLSSANSIILFVGLAVTLLFRTRWLSFSGAPLLGIFAATAAAALFGIKSTSKAELSANMWAGIPNVDFRPLADWRFIFAMFVFFIIDFFGGVGKYVGLFTAMGTNSEEMEKKGLGKSLYIDGIGNIIGGTVGASSLAVFISSAVGISAGGRTGLTAIVTAILMIAGIIFIPVVGAIPDQAVSGILIYVAFLLIPYQIISESNNENENEFSRSDLVICVLTALVALLTYKIDLAILIVFFVYTVQVLWKGFVFGKHFILALTTVLLLIAVLAQFFL